jgi:hypothetical protein
MFIAVLLTRAKLWKSAWVPVNRLRDEENVVQRHNGELFRHKEELNQVLYRKMGGNGDHYAKWNKPDSEK